MCFKEQPTPTHSGHSERASREPLIEDSTSQTLKCIKSPGYAGENADSAGPKWGLAAGIFSGPSGDSDALQFESLP